MKNIIVILSIILFCFSCQQTKKTVYLDELDLDQMEIGWGTAQINKSVDGNPLIVLGQKFTRGVGTHAVSTMLIDLHGTADKITGFAGLDDECGEKASVEFIILGDKEILWQSDILTKGDSVVAFDIDISGINKLGLYVSDGGDYIHYDHADWLEVSITYYGKAPVTISQPEPEPYILTPPPPEEPRINGAKVYGATPRKPFLYKIPVTGQKPMTFSVKKLPSGLELNDQTGIISGTSPEKGNYLITLQVENSLGEDQLEWILIVGDKLALTPPLGWNSWNCWGLSIDQEKVRSAAEAMDSSGLADHGWTYINIDDGWEAAERNAKGELLANEKFPDMKALADEVHNLGLKLGIYSSPGPMTCGGYLGSWEHELQDAQTWSGWGIDYLKYDWCSYGNIATDQSLPELEKPYIHMRKVLNKVNRDIVYSICQYGMGEVWTWGESVGGNLWRTTGDIFDSWNSMAGIGFSQDKCSPYAGPGHWNDPDMLVVGKVGWGPSLHETKLTPDEQYTHISLWCLLASPLLIGCDMQQLDEFTLSLLTNDEVLAVNQDPLGKQASKLLEKDGFQVWGKELYDGSYAIGIFNIGTQSPVEAFTWDNETHEKSFNLIWKEIGLSDKKYMVRDLWRQKNIGTFENNIETVVPFHGVNLFRLKIEK